MPASANWSWCTCAAVRDESSGRQGVEIQIGKDDVEPFEEGRVAERRRCTHGRPDAERDTQIKMVKPPQSIGFRQRQLDGIHDADDLVD